MPMTVTLFLVDVTIGQTQQHEWGRCEVRYYAQKPDVELTPDNAGLNC